jgi:hypothetical protein
MAVLAAAIFLMMVIALAVQMIGREKKTSAAVVLWYSGEDSAFEKELLCHIREEEAAGIGGRRIIIVSADGIFSPRIAEMAKKYDIRLTSADTLADEISRLGKDTWEVKNE